MNNKLTCLFVESSMKFNSGKLDFVDSVKETQIRIVEPDLSPIFLKSSAKS